MESLLVRLVEQAYGRVCGRDEQETPRPRRAWLSKQVAGSYEYGGQNYSAVEHP